MSTNKWDYYLPLKRFPVNRLPECTGCIYKVRVGADDVCDYLGQTNECRPCPPGAQCTVRKEKTVARKTWDKQEAMRLLEAGTPPAEVAEQLGIECSTLRSYLSRQRKAQKRAEEAPAPQEAPAVDEDPEPKGEPEISDEILPGPPPTIPTEFALSYKPAGLTIQIYATTPDELDTASTYLRRLAEMLETGSKL